MAKAYEELACEFRNATELLQAKDNEIAELARKLKTENTERVNTEKRHVETMELLNEVLLGKEPTRYSALATTMLKSINFVKSLANHENLHNEGQIKVLQDIIQEQRRTTGKLTQGPESHSTVPSELNRPLAEKLANDNEFLTSRLALLESREGLASNEVGRLEKELSAYKHTTQQLLTSLAVSQTSYLSLLQLASSKDTRILQLSSSIELAESHIPLTSPDLSSICALQSRQHRDWEITVSELQHTRKEWAAESLKLQSFIENTQYSLSSAGKQQLDISVQYIEEAETLRTINSELHDKIARKNIKLDSFRLDLHQAHGKINSLLSAQSQDRTHMNQLSETITFYQNLHEKETEKFRTLEEFTGTLQEKIGVLMQELSNLEKPHDHLISWSDSEHKFKRLNLQEMEKLLGIAIAEAETLKSLNKSLSCQVASLLPPLASPESLYRLISLFRVLSKVNS